MTSVNPKDQAAIGKVPLELVPPSVVAHIACALLSTRRPDSNAESFPAPSVNLLQPLVTSLSGTLFNWSVVQVN